MSNYWRVGKESRVETLKPDKEDRECFAITYYEGNDSGYKENDIEVKFSKNGALIFWGGESMIYFYPEQIKNLKKLLRKQSSNKGAKQ